MITVFVALSAQDNKVSLLFLPVSLFDNNEWFFFLLAVIVVVTIVAFFIVDFVSC